MVKIFNCTPKPKMLRSVQNERWNVTGALAELVDNSFGEGRGAARTVTIGYDSKTHMLSVLDNGVGMDRIGRLFQHGNSIGHKVGDIGEYGAGGTKALLWMASKVWIWTLRNHASSQSQLRLMQHDSVIWRDWFDLESFDDANVSDDWYPATAANTPAELFMVGHGTLIRMHLLVTRSFRVANIIRDLARLYSTGLRRHRHIRWINYQKGSAAGETIDLIDPFMLPSETSKTISFDFVLEHHDDHLPVYGRVTLDDNTSQSDSRIHIGFGYRVITSTTDCFQSADGEEKYTGIGVSGWLDLGDGWQPYLSTTKDAIDDTPLYQALTDHVFQRIKSLLLEAEKASMNIYFDDLALGLQAALNAQGNEVIVKVGKEIGGSSGDGGSGGDGPGPGPNPGMFPDILQPKIGLPGETDIKVRSLLGIAIVPLNDTAMNRTLCYAEVRGDDVLVAVNEDHPFVQDAMRARPPNRMVLTSIVVNELARTVAEVDNGKLIKRIFRPTTANEILNIEGSHQRSRLIARFLIDRVREPVAAVA